MSTAAATKLTMTLPCALTDAELEERIHEAKQKQDEIAKEVEKIGTLQAAIKLSKSKIEERQDRIADLLRVCDERLEHRRVDCEERCDYEAGAAIVYRLDNGEVVEERPLTLEERQAPLFVAAEPTILLADEGAEPDPDEQRDLERDVEPPLHAESWE